MKPFYSAKAFISVTFQFDRSRKKEKLSLGNSNLSVIPVSHRGHSDSRVKSSSDLSAKTRKSSNVAKSTKTEVKLENGLRIERRIETINEDGKETQMIFENNKLGN